MPLIPGPTICLWEQSSLLRPAPFPHLSSFGLLWPSNSRNGVRIHISEREKGKRRKRMKMREFWGTGYLAMEFMYGLYFSAKRKRQNWGRGWEMQNGGEMNICKNAHWVANWGRYITWVTISSVDTITQYPNMGQALTCFHSKTKKQI